MLKRICLISIPLFLLSGCMTPRTVGEGKQELAWRLDAAEQSAQQATVDKRLAQRELQIAKKKNQVLNEKLALSYDALREARAKLDETLQERITELSESTPGHKLAISQYGGVVLESGILFAPGSHKLTPSGKKALGPIVKTLSKEEYSTYEIELVGHSDKDPIRKSKKRYRDNWDLASSRANSVRGYLAQQGVPTKQIYLSSWGATRPIDAKNKSKNRRVEIVLHSTADSVPASAPREEKKQ